VQPRPLQSNGHGVLAGSQAISVWSVRSRGFFRNSPKFCFSGSMLPPAFDQPKPLAYYAVSVKRYEKSGFVSVSPLLFPFFDGDSVKGILSQLLRAQMTCALPVVFTGGPQRPFRPGDRLTYDFWLMSVRHDRAQGTPDPKRCSVKVKNLFLHTFIAHHIEVLRGKSLRI
jgi:hypothetical protein